MKNLSYLATDQGPEVSDHKLYREAPEPFKALFVNSPIGIFLLQDGKFKFVNPKFERSTGYGEKELLGTYPDRLIHPECRERIKLSAIRTLKGQYSSPYEYQGIRKDGKVLWIMETITSVEYQGKRAVLGNFMDITEQKKVQGELQESEERLRTVIETVKEGITLSDEDGRFVLYNSEMEQLTGYSLDEANTFPDFTKFLYRDVDGRWDAIESFKRAASKSVSLEMETEIITREGLSKNVLVSTCSVLFKGQKMFLTAYRDITDRKCAEEELKRTLEKLRKAVGATIKAISATIETRDPYTAGHQQRVTNLARTIATEMGIGEDRIDTLRMAGAIHDIGKICVPAEILCKPGKITEIEFTLIKSHAQVGFEILKDIEFPWPIAEIVLQHHERLDGSGYPRGLKDGAILLESRILAVADVVESIASHRPYRASLGIEAALDEIERNKGILYDAEVVDTCVRLFRENRFKFE